MKQIILTQNQVALVDDADFVELNKYKWHAAFSKNTGTYYAGNRTCGLMSRFILGLTDPKVFAEHRNGDTLDNQRENLRRATALQNSANRKISVSNTSGYKGVHWSKGSKKWRATIRVNGKKFHIGLFVSIEDAHTAYQNKAKEVFGEFVRVQSIAAP